MRREVRLLEQKAVDSLILSIELFNRPRNEGRFDEDSHWSPTATLDRVPDDQGSDPRQETSRPEQTGPDLPGIVWEEFDGAEAERLLKTARRAGARSFIRARLDPLDRDRILRTSGGLCGICGSELHEIVSEGRATGVQQWEIDHIVPLARGGDHVYSNLQPVHPYCNSRKRDHLLTYCEWPPGIANADLRRRYLARQRRELAAWKELRRATAELALTERQVHLIEQADGWSNLSSATRARLWADRLATLGRAPGIAHWWLAYPERRRAASGQPDEYMELIEEAKRRGGNVLNVDGVWAIGWLNCGEIG